MVILQEDMIDQGNNSSLIVKKKIVLIERICYKNIHLLLPNTDCLQQVEYSVRGCT
jgi:hypothetical protein